MSNLIHEDLTYTIKGVLFEVYNKLSLKLPEQFYQNAITQTLRNKGIPCESEKEFQIIYRNEVAGTYRIDNWVDNGKVLIELKVRPEISPTHKAQAISYLKLTNADLAIVANFGAKSLQTKGLPNIIRNKKPIFQWQLRPLPNDILYPNLTNKIYKALHQVHYTLGPGYIHRAYQQAMSIELKYQDIGYEFISKIPFTFQGCHIGDLDVQIFKIEDKVLLGAFALQTYDAEEEGMKMKIRLERLGAKVGILANFFGERLVVNRILRT